MADRDSSRPEGDPFQRRRYRQLSKLGTALVVLLLVLWSIQATVIACLLAVLLMTFVALLGATFIQKFLGVTGLQVIGRIFGVLLSALAVQFIFDGIGQSGLLA